MTNRQKKLNYLDGVSLSPTNLHLIRPQSSPIQLKYNTSLLHKLKKSIVKVTTILQLLNLVNYILGEVICLTDLALLSQKYLKFLQLLLFKITINNLWKSIQILIKSKNLMQSKGEKVSLKVLTVTFKKLKYQEKFSFMKKSVQLPLGLIMS